MQAEISMAMASFNVLKDIGAAFIGERDRQKALAIEIDFTKQLIDLQSKLVEVLSASVAKDALYQAQADRIRQIEAAASEKERYELAQISAVGNFFAYGLRAPSELAHRPHEPKHFLCQTCLDIRQHKSVLMFRGTDCTCPACKTSFAVGQAVAAVTVRSRRSGIADNF